MPRRLALVAVLGGLALLAVACGIDEGSTADGGSGQPTIVVTTSLLGDVVRELVGESAQVDVLMAPGADPHDVQLSARQAAEVREADALITNGAGFEQGMLDSLEAAEADGVATYAAIDAVEPLELDGEDPHEGEGEDEHAEEAHDHGDVDPHFFTDPDRMAAAAQGIADFLAAEVPALDDDAFRASAAAEVASLEALAADLDETLSVIPADRRKLVTNHEVFGYFADRYDFEVVGAVVPGGGTGAEASAGDLAELAATVEEEGVPAIFADVSSPESLADALAAEAGDVEVVTLFTESLGPDGSGGETYDAMMRTNATRVVDALS